MHFSLLQQKTNEVKQEVIEETKVQIQTPTTTQSQLLKKQNPNPLS
jgi:hypothetical protein